MENKPITKQRIYAVLRKAGHQAAKWHTSGMVRGWGSWSPGVRVEGETGALTVTYEVYGSSGEGQIRNVMENYVVPALRQAGIEGDLSEDGQTYAVRSA